MPCTCASLFVLECEDSLRCKDGVEGLSVKTSEAEKFGNFPNGETLPNSGMEGDWGIPTLSGDVLPLYGRRVPFTRSGDSGNSGMPGEAGVGLSGGGSIFAKEQVDNLVSTLASND